MKDLGLCFNLKKYIMAFCSGCGLWVFLFGICITMVGGIAPKGMLEVPLWPIFGASLLLGILEEVIFRGVVFEFFKKNYGENASMWMLAFLFACLHFSMCMPGDATNVFWGAIQCAYNSLAEIFIHIQWIYFICLLLLSCILLNIRQMFGSLWVSIGFHQGLVFVLMLLRKKYTFTHCGNAFWGTGHITDAWFSVVMLIGIWLVLEHYRKTHEKNS